MVCSLALSQSNRLSKVTLSNITTKFRFDMGRFSRAVIDAEFLMTGLTLIYRSINFDISFGDLGAERKQLIPRL
jgi:hypothetical protein